MSKFNEQVVLWKKLKVPKWNMQCILRNKHYHRKKNIENLINVFNRIKYYSTVDINDVEHHSKLAKGWWDPNGPVAPLHSLNGLR